MNGNMQGMTNAQAALIAAATQASRGNAMGITPLLEKASQMLDWLDAQDLAERAGAYVPKAQQPLEYRAQPVTVCGHSARRDGIECLLAKGHTGVHRATHEHSRYEWSDHSNVMASRRD